MSNAWNYRGGNFNGNMKNQQSVMDLAVHRCTDPVYQATSVTIPSLGPDARGVLKPTLSSAKSPFSPQSLAHSPHCFSHPRPTPTASPTLASHTPRIKKMPEILKFIEGPLAYGINGENDERIVTITTDGSTTLFKLSNSIEFARVSDTKPPAPDTIEIYGIVKRQGIADFLKLEPNTNIGYSKISPDFCFSPLTNAWWPG